MKLLLFICSYLPFLLALNSLKPTSGPFDLPKNPPSQDTLTIADCQRCLVLTEQAESAIAIYDVADNRKLIWYWDPSQSSRIKKPDWFSNPSEIKPVYDKKYLLITASGGGVALIRIADKKVVFHAYAGGNPHSAELFPDGNMVVASSTGNYLTLFHVDTLQSTTRTYQKQVPIPFGHNVVWDKKRQLLWSAGKNQLYAYHYNFNCHQPNVTLVDSVQLPGDNAHDLFPAYGQDALWLTNTNGIYKIDMETMQVAPVESKFTRHIKSVSSGPEGYATIIIKPKTKWWTDTIVNLEGNIIFKGTGMKIYKARWFLPNSFSYPDKHSFTACR